MKNLPYIMLVVFSFVMITIVPVMSKAEGNNDSRNKTYVLVIQAKTGYATSLTTQEFNSYKNCKKALDDFKIISNYTTGGCYEK